MTREQFTTFVSKEQKRLRQFLLALCLGNRPEADDIAQDALVKAYLSSSDYREEGKLTAWLYTIAYRTFLDHRKAHRLTQSLDDEATLQPSDPASEADSAFRYQALYQALDALPPKERMAILLFYLKGYNIREISHIVEASEDAVKKQLSRGREQLKNLLQHDERR